MSFKKKLNSSAVVTSVRIHLALLAALSFVKRWSDVLIFLPAGLILFIFNDRWIRAIDETANTMDVGNLALLNFNFLKFILTASAAYLVYNLFFHDFFKKGWEDRVSPVVASVIHVFLWISTLVLAYLTITKHL